MRMNVYPGAKRPTHHISLSDGVRTFGLRLEDGPRSVQEIPMTPSTVHFSGGGTKFGDWEPGMSHIEQRTWEGGRGQADFVEDPTRYYDSKNAWTLTPGKVFPTPRWKFTKGHMTEVNQRLPGDMDWRTLYGDYDRIADPFSHSTSWSTYDKLYLWVRKMGNPGTMTVYLKADSGGSPAGVNHASDTLEPSAVNEGEVYLHEFDLSGGTPLVGTSTWIVVYGNDTDDAANHWEIGVDVDGGTGKYQFSHGIWYAAAFSFYHRITSAKTERKWHFFEFQGALYAIDQKATKAASELYLNGDRGKATSANSSSIRDTNKSWTTDQWLNCWVKITGGTGVGQRRSISGTNAATQALNITPDWTMTPDTTSEYVIYHTDQWQDISPASGDLIDGVVKSVAVVGDYAAFAQGQSVTILKMRWNPSASPPAHEFDDDGANKADLLLTTVDATNAVQVYRANTAAATVSHAAPTAWATAMTFGTSIDVGESNQPIVSLYVHDGQLYAFKPDGRYSLAPEDNAAKTIGEMGFIKSENNGQAVLSYGLFVYFSWGGYALMRLYDLSGKYDLSSIGPDRDEGLPDPRRGAIVALQGTPSGIVAAIDGGDDRFSSVLVMPLEARGWHEVFRGAQAGARVQNIFFQDSYQPRLWIDYDGDLIYQDWPRHTSNPLKDSGMTFNEEAHLISSTIDMGVSRLPKLIKEITAIVEHLGSGNEIRLDYQVNEDVGTDTWTEAGTFQLSPEDTVLVRVGEVYKVRYRLRMMCNDESRPPVVHATVLEGFARTPVKYQWTMRIHTGSTQRDLSGAAKDSDPDEFLTWLKEAAVHSRRIFMRSIWGQMDSRYVVVEPPTLLRKFTNNLLGYWGGSVVISLREI